MVNLRRLFKLGLSRAQQRELIDVCDNLLAVIGNANRGAFDNGVWDPTGSICEGEVLVGRRCEEARILLRNVRF